MEGKEKSGPDMQSQEPSDADMKRLIEKYPENFTGEILKSSKVQTTEQEKAASAALMEELKTLATPLVQWVRENYGYHTEVHISADFVCIKHDGMAIPYLISEK